LIYVNLAIKELIISSNQIFSVPLQPMNKNVILVDADYADRVAFDLTVNFERMIGRQIPKADMARWADCVALDGGVREGDDETKVILIHDKESSGMKNFAPGTYASELNGQAFKDNLGEFVFESYPVEELTTKTDFMLDILQTVCRQEDVKRIMIVSDDLIYKDVRDLLRKVNDDGKRITVFTMAPMPDGQFLQEILGFSLTAALGVKSDELNPNQ